MSYRGGQAVYAHNDVPDVTQTFQNSVLVKNWYEDRFQGQVASASGRAQPTKERVIHQALPDGHPGLWNTTKNDTDQHMLTSPPPAKIKKPSIYTDGNLADRLTTYGLADSVAYTIGPNPATEAAKPAPRFMTTTNKDLYETKPQEAIAANPDTFRSGPSPHGLTDGLTKSIRGEPTDQPNVVGGKGSRGEITRRPGESGSVYGVSVFVDEYSKWGTALKGVPLDETASKKQTKYF
ncbi:hypothetical protein PLESTB_000186500 [Pleodorina starrii]|uniref:Uncharacterized protein n=1 Tax=Pleodorina starrii TaxID=330485 RepID=A0A9W6EXP0_9CHLO|nr:hypothetical protein PLESTM_000344800 [Pleodorina starrii]GLC49138.1 hypothetical protein PLESTB_000186500 [Pleodorina starrii]GLC73605.1 hypothetical protein PLESTF_001396100 [Pleodorina starrii]